MITYEQWNKAIISYFFEDCEPGEIVFLQTNAEELYEIAEFSAFNVSDAADSLKMAVRHKVVRSDAVDFRAVKPILWKDYSKEDPPQIAFLALTVFAASKMETLNYYEPLNDLFFDDPDRGRWKQGDLENIEKFWKHLQNWVEYQHDIKLHLTKGPPNQRFVWYPKSQCLISKYDEHKLHALFQETALKPGVYLAEKQLLDILCSSGYFQNLSVKIKRPILDQKTAETRLILGQVQLLLENWDGEVQEMSQSGIRKKRESYTIDVQLSSNTFSPIDEVEVSYWFRCKREKQITFKHNSLNVETLQPLDDQWFEPHVMRGNSLLFQVFQNGTELKTTDAKPLTYRIRPTDIWVFRWDSDRADGWLSQGNLLLHEEHLIVYRRKLQWKVISFLQRVCDEIPAPKSIRTGVNKTSWQYINIEPTALSDLSLLGFRVTTSDKINFVGGLPLDRRSNTYFDFCPPAIVFPNLIADSNEPFYMNGQAEEIPSGRKIEFRDKLDSGEYRFSYLDCQSTLRIVSSKRSREYQEKTLAAELFEDQETIPTYSVESTTEIVEKSGLLVAGAKLFGTDIPEVTWNDVQDVPIKKLPEKEVSNQLSKSPAQLISSVVKMAIELKNNKVSIPEWFDDAIKYLDENVAIRTLVQKKLQDYHETALSYADLRKYIGG